MADDGDHGSRGIGGETIDNQPPSDDIGWKFAKQLGDKRHKMRCLFCNKLMNGGITRLKQHLAHQKGQVTSCPNVSAEVRMLMMQHLMDGKDKLLDKRKRKDKLMDDNGSGGGPNGGQNEPTYHNQGDNGIRGSSSTQEQRRHSVSSTGVGEFSRRSRHINEIYGDQNLGQRFGQLGIRRDQDIENHWQEQPPHLCQPIPPYVGKNYPHHSYQYPYAGMNYPQQSYQYPYTESSSYGSNTSLDRPTTHGYSQQSSSSGTHNNFEHCNFTNHYYVSDWSPMGKQTYGEDRDSGGSENPPVAPRNSFWRF